MSSIGTEAGLKAASVTLTDFPASDVTSEPGLLVYGPVGYEKKDGSTNPVALLARMKRAYAKVTVDFTAQNGIAITSAEIKNIPPSVYPFPVAGTTPVIGGSAYITQTLTAEEKNSGNCCSGHLYLLFLHARKHPGQWDSNDRSRKEYYNERAFRQSG
ncbi:MAG: hypothetical protein LUE99_14460 [Bacteroides sp.]|nr:hypothetical protein [Bacteroides sp.]